MTASHVPTDPPAHRTVGPDLPLDPGVAALSSRVFVQSIPQRVSWIIDQLDPSCSGLVVSGAKALAKAGKLRQAGTFSGPVLVDPAVYTVQAATEEEPFPIPAGTQMAFGDHLANAVEQQLDHGASAALSPTGYVHAKDSDALLAAARRITELADPRLIFVVPLGAGWLRDDAVKQLIAVLQLVPGAKALMLGGQLDPLGHFPQAVGNLVKVLAEVPHCALLRADLAAFGALAHGAAFTAFGATSGLRHIVPPPQPAKTTGGPGSPHVLVEDLMAFFLGRKIADRFAATQAPICQCTACQGRALDTFASPKEQVPAAAHNAAVLTSWIGSLTAQEPVLRAVWWQQRCQNAVDRYDIVNTTLRQPGAFAPPRQLVRWAQRPASTPRTAEASSSG
ncbi:hypothetical protein OG511_42195 [Streptomyces sp. NBC_01453]|uniref:hypothetical protein n=1 Tax=Streptomyces sp. NBC_01453 TaxID=2903873 RepID=UPI002E2BFBB9|nr:hypothetical protein [Streptomyces sp. NBC_01453]